MFALSILPVLVIAAFSDIRSHRIPNWLTCSAAVTGIAYYTYTGGWMGLGLSMGGLFLGLALLIGFHLTGGMGAGDVKLMGALGAMLGPAGVFKAWLCSALVGGVYAAAVLLMYYGPRNVIRLCESLSIMVYHRTFSSSVLKKKEGVPVLSYGVAISVGTLISMLVFR